MITSEENDFSLPRVIIPKEIPPPTSPSQSCRILKGPVFSMAVSTTHILAGHHNGIIDAVLISGEGEITEIAAHTGIVKQLTVVETSGRKILLSCSADRTIKSWNLKDFQWLMTFSGHHSSVDCILVDGKGTLYSAGVDGSLRVWNVDSGECLKRIKCHIGRITGLLVPVIPHVERTENEPEPEPLRPNTIVTVSDDTLAQVVDPNTKLVHTMIKAGSPILCAAYFHPMVIVGCLDGVIRGFHVNTAVQLASFKGHTDGVNSLLVHPDGLLCGASDDCTVQVWSIKTWKRLHAFVSHERCVSCISFDSANGMLFSGSFDCEVRSWNIGSVALALKESEKPPPKEVSKKKKEDKKKGKK